MDLTLGPADPAADDVRALLEHHLAFSRAVTPPEGVHALSSEGARDPAVTFFGAWIGGRLVGVGGLKHLDETHAELKSLHTVEAARGQGIGLALVDQLLSLAAERGYQRVSLETGNMDAFAPARALYAKVGFKPCGPFGEYRGSPTSACMTIEVDGTGPA
jgi:putative acetyltransferase